LLFPTVENKIIEFIREFEDFVFKKQKVLEFLITYCILAVTDRNEVMDDDEEIIGDELYNPICSVCEKKTNRKKIFLPILTNNDGCLCAKCFYRLPEDLYVQIRNNASNLTGHEFNTIIVNALKNTREGLDLNEHFYLLVNSFTKCEFEKFVTRKELMRAYRGYMENGAQVIDMFDCGKKIVIKNP